MSDYKKIEGLKPLPGFPTTSTQTPLKSAYEAAMKVPVGDKTVEELAQDMYAANADYWDHVLKVGPRCRTWEKTASWVRQTWIDAAQGRINKERGTK